LTAVTKQTNKKKKEEEELNMARENLIAVMKFKNCFLLLWEFPFVSP
jgi:hypothetical protein